MCACDVRALSPTGAGLVSLVPVLEPWMSSPPTSAAQTAVLSLLARSLEPLRREHALPAYELRAGVRLRRLWGRCQHFTDGRRPQVLVRCTADGDRSRWRRPGAIVATLLHEMAHLKYRGHGPRFWSLHRRLLDEAALLGIYRADQDDPTEGARGDEKLAGSAADHVAQAARERRRQRAAENRAAAKRWAAGGVAKVNVSRGPLAGAQVHVLAVARGWLTVAAPNGRRYRVAACALEPLEVEALSVGGG